MRISVPFEIASMVILNQIHPVAAWRNYYGASQAELAALLCMTEMEVKQLETTNQHLKSENITKLCRVFNIVPEALAIRHLTYLS